jgi:hypothetical protein
MFLCPVSITALWHFILGYGLGQASVSTGAKSPFALPSDFHDWVASRLHFFASTSGWHNMIIERFGDGPHAFDRFFSLLDEYHLRVPSIVATLSGCERTYTEFFKGEEHTRSFPSNISLISYNAEDPGLFVSAEGSDHFPGKGFCPSLNWFEDMFGPCRSNLAILDQAAYDRWAHQPPPTEP